MLDALPPHPYCWVYSKWGRKKAHALLEYRKIGGKEHGNIFVLVKMIDKMIPRTDRMLLVEKKDTEYIQN